jgi:hypothetical protein
VVDAGTLREADAGTRSRGIRGPKKRGRRRLPTTGKYVGLEKTKVVLRTFQKEEDRRNSKAELEENVKPSSSQRLKLHAKVRQQILNKKPRSATEVMIRTRGEVYSITSIAVRSKKLKEPIVRSLKDSAHAIKEAMGNLALISTGRLNCRVKQAFPA